MVNSTVLEKKVGGVKVVKKNRERLTVYVDKNLYDFFVADASGKYRSLSDHMNAILYKYRAEQEANEPRAANQNGYNQQ